MNRNSGDIFEEGAARVVKYAMLGLNYIAILKANLVGILGSEKTMTMTSTMYNSGSTISNLPYFIFKIQIFYRCFQQCLFVIPTQ